MASKHSSSVDFIVVIAVDNSINSEYAFTYYATEVHRPDYKVRVVHCSEGWVKLKDGGVGNVQEMKTKEEEKVQGIRSKYTNMMTEHKIVGGKFDVVGGKDPWHQIIEYQEKQGAQLIVIGTRGSNAIRRTLMGSVSDSVVHHAHCPVLVCRHAAK